MDGLLTIGYEGAEIGNFLTTLKAASVTTLLDVREMPLSRKPGFSKNALAAELRSHGIVYLHERHLGSPKPIRDRLRRDGDYNAYFSSFTTHLKSQVALLARLAGDIEGNVVLMCFERDAATCHRSVVARQLEALTGLATRHLGVEHGPVVHRKSTHSCQGVSTAESNL